MKIADFSVKRPVTILMIMIVLVIIGTIAVPLLPVDLMPNLQIPTLSVATSWAGASPGEVENQVTKKIEAQLATVPGVTEIDSTSRAGASAVVLHFDYGVNLDQAMLNVRDKVDRAKRSLPADADAPTVNRIDLNAQPIMSLVVYGKGVDQVTLRNIADNTVSPAVQRVDGVAAVSVSGGRQRQILVQVDPVKMTGYGITINQIVSALGSDNTSMDAGQLAKGSSMIPLHIDGDFRSVADIQKVQVQSKGGSIPISQVATIVDTYKEKTLDARKDGQEAVSMSVTKQSDGNTVSVSNGVQKELADIQKKLPKGVQVSVLTDSAAFIRDSINTVVSHTLLGGVFSIVILLLFLRNVRATVIIGVVIPIAVISTFSMMYFSNQTINTITLGGLALGLGSLVDFAVVVLESIFRKRSQGLPMDEAAKQGTKEVGTAVLASALAQVAVFAPAAFTGGMAQQIFLPIALTVAFSHIAALFAAVTLVPMMASKMLKGDFEADVEAAPPAGKTWNPAIWFQRGMFRVYKGYGRLLGWALGHRKTVVLATLVLFVGSVALIPMVGTELTPTTDQGKFTASVSLPNGASFDDTNKVASQVEDLLRKVPEVDSIYTLIGSGGGNGGTAATNQANIQVSLKKSHARSTDVVVEDVRTKVQSLATNGTKINLRAQNSSMGMGGGGGGGGGGAGAAGGGDVTVVVTGSDLRVLQKLGDLVAQQIGTLDGVRNVTNTLDKSSPQYELTIDRDAAAHFGVAPKDIMTALRSAFQGSAATALKTGDSQVDITVSYPSDYTKDIANVNNMIITTSSGAQIPLSEVAKVTLGSSPASISRQNQVRGTTVTATAFNVPVGTLSKEVQQVIDGIQPPDGYQIYLGGSNNDMNQSFKSLGLMLILSIVLVYMVMASQFESLYGPFVIMFSLPPTFVGALIGLVVTHRTINMNSIIGMIMLVGIVVNNAIVLVDYTNQMRREGLSLKDALLKAGPIRLRPILMTTGTTVLAMLPLVIGFGEGAETQASMATVVAFGLVFSTLVTLVLVPVVYMIFDNWIEKFKGRFRKKKQVEPANPVTM